MRLLLDTHVFLWYISADAKLPASFRMAIRDPANEVHLSVASVWEAVIKHSLGRLPLPDSPAQYLTLQRETHRFISLPVEEAAISHLAELPNVHRDPFDRILIAQSLQHQLTLVTMDNLIQAYPVSLLPLS